MEFSREIIKWYYENKRSLPWRNCSDPYKIWISEIILQQTRVKQGLPYFNRFIETCNIMKRRRNTIMSGYEIKFLKELYNKII